VRPRLVLAEPDAPSFDHGCSPAAPGSELEALFRRHQGWLLGLLRFRYGAEAAEDLLQEAFLRAARRAEIVAEVLHPRAWLATLALSAARDRHRRHQVRAHVNEAPGNDAALPTGSHQDQALLLKQVILSLPPHLKDTFVLSRFADLTYAEIAEHQQIPVKTVEWRITKAMKLIAERLRD
jgi:RNA polymerase sigma-70 factor (ECF subfamily)